MPGPEGQYQEIQRDPTVAPVPLKSNCDPHISLLSKLNDRCVGVALSASPQHPLIRTDELVGRRLSVLEPSDSVRSHVTMFAELIPPMVPSVVTVPAMLPTPTVWLRS